MIIIQHLVIYSLIFLGSLKTWHIFFINQSHTKLAHGSNKNRSGIYQAQPPIEVSADTSTSSTTSAQQPKSEDTSRLSGSDIKSSGFISSSSLAISSIGGGGGSQSGTPSVGTNSNVGSGDSSPTPTQHRRLAKSFSVAPSLSQTTKGW